MKSQVRSTGVVDFFTPGAGILVLGCGRVGDKVKKCCFLRDLLYSRHSWEGLVMMSGEGPAKTVDSMAPGILCWGVARSVI